MTVLAPGPTREARPPVAPRRRGWQWFSRLCFLLAGLLTAGSLALAAGIGEGGTTVAASAPVRDAPEYSARLLGSEERVGIAAGGEVFLLNTWATWCKPCRDEMPDFEVLHRRHAADGLRVVGVNIDESAGDEAVRSFVTDVGAGFEMWRNPNNNFGKKFRVLGPPETFLVADGKILRHWRGQMDPNAPENLPTIQAALGIGAAEGLGTVSTVATAGLLVAFCAGLISVLSPCVLP